MILYFSGTGNTEYLAKAMAKDLDDELIDLFPLIKNGEKITFDSKKPLIILGPTYSWRMPKFMMDYLRTASFTGNKDVYFLLNYGSSFGNADKYLKADAREMGLNYRGLYGIQMPENYLMLFDLDSDDFNKKLIEEAIPQVKEAADIIKNDRNFPNTYASLLDKALSALVNPVFYKFILGDKKFYYTDKCIECGICEKSCVLNNISCAGGPPSWKGNCTHCQSCLSKCPKSAIEYGKKTLGKKRYLLKDLLDKYLVRFWA